MPSAPNMSLLPSHTSSAPAMLPATPPTNNSALPLLCSPSPTLPHTCALPEASALTPSVPPPNKTGKHSGNKIGNHSGNTFRQYIPAIHSPRAPSPAHRGGKTARATPRARSAAQWRGAGCRMQRVAAGRGGAITITARLARVKNEKVRNFLRASHFQPIRQPFRQKSGNPSGKDSGNA